MIPRVPRTRLRQRNEERAAKLYKLQFGGPLYDGTPDTDYSERIRRMPCCVPGCCAKGKSDPHHVPTRGAGGIWSDQSPICPGHHDEAHLIGVSTFEVKHGISFRAVAREHADEYRQEVGLAA